MPLRPALTFRLGALAALALAAGALAACSQNADARPGQASAGPNLNGSPSGKFTASEYVMGSAKAPVSVVEYLSDTCSHCARFDAEVFPAIKKNYIDTGKVKWTIREFLTPPEAVSAAGFVLARCAGRDKYWPVVEAIFHSQEDMFKSGDVKGTFLKIAQSMGMDEKQFDACVQDDAAFKALNERVQKAMTVDKIDSTPTLIVNGKTYVSEMNLAEMQKAIADAGAPAKT